jgi:hypothetical protein
LNHQVAQYDKTLDRLLGQYISASFDVVVSKVVENHPEM